MRKFRRLSGVASAHNDDTNEDLLVDMVALEKLASQKPTPVRLKDMQLYACSPSDSKQRLRNAQFLHKELPIRMAQRAMDLLTLPHGLNETIAVRKVASIYLKYIEMFQNTPPPTNMKEEAEFTDMLQNIILDRQTIPTSIAKGIASWYESNKDIDPEHLQEMENALYRFFTARVGLRFLTQHHILSDVNRTPAGPLEYAKTNLGCIQVDFDPVEEIKNVIDQVTRQTIDCYGCCPEIELVDSSIVDKKKKKSGFTYVPHHLQFMVTELLKNSCRATVDKYYGEDKMPSIRVVVVQGKEDVTIKVCDQGGGAPRSTMEKIWKFAHSTSPSLEQETEFAKDVFSGGKIRGFGLPLARIYARYFGGELTLLSMEGHGVDAYLYLPRLGYSSEKLPKNVKTSPGNSDSTVDLYSMEPIVTRPGAVNGGEPSAKTTTADPASIVL
jgi:pyruvate dehydrogenase kinase 2/3/4